MGVYILLGTLLAEVGTLIVLGIIGYKRIMADLFNAWMAMTDDTVDIIQAVNIAKDGIRADITYAKEDNIRVVRDTKKDLLNVMKERLNMEVPDPEVIDDKELYNREVKKVLHDRNSH